jgi:hypothetical protein
MMKPIICNTHSVLGILEGRKTHTRRVMKPQPVLYRDNEWTFSKKGFWSHYSAMLAQDETFFGWTVDDSPPKEAIYHHNPYGVPGDKLWVRETYSALPHFDDKKPSEIPDFAEIIYLADGENAMRGKTRPSIFMCQWMSRIMLEIKDVRVERVQEIDIEDVVAEGIEPSRFYEQSDDGNVTGYDEEWGISLFADLWDSINEKRGYGWDVNPWVWVIEFERIKP